MLVYIVSGIWIHIQNFLPQRSCYQMLTVDQIPQNLNSFGTSEDEPKTNQKVQLCELKEELRSMWLFEDS